MRCVLAEAERLYGAHVIPFFTLSCAYVNGKKEMRFPKSWQRLGTDAPQLRALSKNAVCVRTGYSDYISRALSETQMSLKHVERSFAMQKK